LIVDEGGCEEGAGGVDPAFSVVVSNVLEFWDQRRAPFRVLRIRIQEGDEEIVEEAAEKGEKEGFMVGGGEGGGDGGVEVGILDNLEDDLAKGKLAGSSDGWWDVMDHGEVNQLTRGGRIRDREIGSGGDLVAYVGCVWKKHEENLQSQVEGGESDGGKIVKSIGRLNICAGEFEVGDEEVAEEGAARFC